MGIAAGLTDGWRTVTHYPLFFFEKCLYNYPLILQIKISHKFVYSLIEVAMWSAYIHIQNKNPGNLKEIHIIYMKICDLGKTTPK